MRIPLRVDAKALMSSQKVMIGPEQPAHTLGEAFQSDDYWEGSVILIFRIVGDDVLESAIFEPGDEESADAETRYSDLTSSPTSRRTHLYYLDLDDIDEICSFK